MTESQKYLVKGQYQVLSFQSGAKFPIQFLKDTLPDVATAVFFAKVYHLTADELSVLIAEVFPSRVTEALLKESDLHSTTLQDYLVDQYWDDTTGDWEYDIEGVHAGEVGSVEPVQAEILPEVWKGLELKIADSIAEVADKLRDTVARMPGRTGQMVFQTLAKVNATRPVIGDYRAAIQHQQVQRVLVVFDVSGSMSQNTVRTIVDDVVGLAYESNAALAIVSDTCTFWDPGAYNTEGVLAAAEYSGTHYETLAPLFEQSWDAVITVADYDSSPTAQRVLAACSGRIGQLFDISLVSRSTYLAECLAQLADEVKPLLISSRSLCW